MPSIRPAGAGKSLFVSVVLIVFPALLFYSVVFQSLVNLPFWDDYETLNFLIHQHALHGWWAKTVYALTAQHNEYKLILENSVISLQYLVIGHVNFAFFSFVGDLSMAVLVFVLWKMFLPDEENVALRAALFIPVSWLIFQFSYHDTLNWGVTTIQNLFIPTFSITAFLLLVPNRTRYFAGALVCLVLAIATSGNGFIAAFVGMLMLLHARRMRDALVWIGVTLLMMLLYAYHYNKMSSQTSSDHSVFAQMRHLKIRYVITFLGALGNYSSLIPRLPILAGVIFLGFLLILFFAYQGRKGKLSANPAVTAAVLFIFFTSVGVASIRSDFGVGQSIDSRYRIYSTIFLVLAWFVVAEKYLHRSSKPLGRNAVFLGGCVFAIVFSLRIDWVSYGFFANRVAMLKEGIGLYEHPTPGAVEQGPLFLHSEKYMDAKPEMNDMFRGFLDQAAELGIYRPANY